LHDFKQLLVEGNVLLIGDNFGNSFRGNRYETNFRGNRYETEKKDG